MKLLELTGVQENRAGIAVLQDAITRIRLSGNSELTVALLEIDGLQAANHGRGDLTLAALADVLRASLRREDIVFRYGGDGFVCAMPFTSVRVAGDLLLGAWRTLRGLGWCTFSAGFADLRDGDDAATLVARAEECLYAGRRR